jgi:hypothetical protein
MARTTGDLVPLNAGLKEQFQKLFRAVKRNTTALAKQAFQIHSEHYLRTDRKYDKDFEAWWEAQGLEQVFGSRDNWTKWYRAGEALEKVHAQFDNYANKLPTTRDALYEIAFFQPEELRLCLENRYTRSSVTQPKAEWKRPTKRQPVINPGAGTIPSDLAINIRRSWRPRRTRDNKPVCEFYLASSEYRRLDLHHRTYKRLGYETEHDFVLICERCHPGVHNTFNKGRKSLWTTTRKYGKWKQGYR